MVSSLGDSWFRKLLFGFHKCYGRLIARKMWFGDFKATWLPDYTRHKPGGFFQIPWGFQFLQCNVSMQKNVSRVSLPIGKTLEVWDPFFETSQTTSSLWLWLHGASGGFLGILPPQRIHRLQPKVRESAIFQYIYFAYSHIMDVTENHVVYFFGGR